MIGKEKRRQKLKDVSDIEGSDVFCSTADFCIVGLKNLTAKKKEKVRSTTEPRY